MTAPLPPELAEKLKWIAVCHRSAPSVEAIMFCFGEAYPLIAAHVAKRAAEICRSGMTADEFYTFYKQIGYDKCAEAIERELIGG